MLIEKEMAAAFWKRIAHLPHDEQRTLIRAAPVFETKALYDFLVGRAAAIGRQDRSKAPPILELALVAIQVLPRDYKLDHQRETLLGLAQARLGHAYCLAFQLRDAELALTQAFRHLRSAPPTAKAEALCRYADLLRYRRQFNKAENALLTALQSWREANDRGWISRSLIQLGMTYYEGGRDHDALRPLREALALADPLDQRLRVTIHHNIATAAYGAGLAADAAHHLAQIRQASAASTEPAIGAMLSWLDGLILEESGQTERAIQALTESRATLIGLPSPGHAALVSLDLALVYLRQRDHQPVVPLLNEARELLHALDNHREARAVETILHRAVASEDACRELVLQSRQALQAIAHGAVRRRKG